jgi:predicted phage tail component-like protein
MANYNTGRLYNHKLPDGGATYNSAPFSVIILDYGQGLDAITKIIPPLIEIIETAIGNDTISILASMSVSDAGTGRDIVSIAKAYFIIDAESIMQPLGVLVVGDSRFDIFPQLKEYTEEIPGKHGEINFGSNLGSRPLELHVASMDGMTPEEKEEFKRLCARYLNPVSGAKPLIFKDDINKTYSVKYAGKIDPTQYADWLEFTIPFKMTGSYIEGSFEKKQIGSGTITNSGNIETGLRIEISGAVTDPTVVIGDDTLSYDGTINAGETLVIDTENMTAELDGENVLHNLTGDLPLMLQPGETAVTADSNVTFIWRERWV